MEIIAAQNITRQYSTGHGIQDVSLSVHRGQCFGVLGANGSGKTTLTRLIAGLDRIQQGRLSVLGQSVYPLPAAIRCRCGVALDTPAHWDTLSGRHNLTFFARQYGLTGDMMRQRLDELFEKSNLTARADDPVATYSFGMKRKLTILEALTHTPELLILDEPSAGLDMTFLDMLAQWIRHRCDEGKTTWIADNDADWLAKTATDVILLNHGRITASGTVTELINSIDARCRITIELDKCTTLDTPPIDGIVRFQCSKNQISADVDGDPHLPAQLLAWITDAGGQVRSMDVRSITLHEALQRRSTQQAVNR